MLLQPTHTRASLGRPARLPAHGCRMLPHLPRPRHPRGAAQVVSFKAGDKEAEEVVQRQEQQLTKETTGREAQPTTGDNKPAQTSEAKPRHRNAVDKSVHTTREAIDKLLGHSHHDPSTRQAPAAPSSSASGQQGIGGRAAKQPPAFQAPLSVPVFSRRREVFVGRAAMAGFYASCMWEMLTGLGPVSQLTVSTGLPNVVVQAVLGAFVLHGLYGFSPSTPTWSAQNRNDLLRRPRGFPRALINPITEPARFLGFSQWGFTKANELFAGRLAMLGWTGVAIMEQLTGGRGALGQVAWWLHLPVNHTYYEVCNIALVVAPIVFAVAAYIKRRPGQLGGGDDIYS